MRFIPKRSSAILALLCWSFYTQTAARKTGDDQ
jgi:hypothetical protein